MAWFKVDDNFLDHRKVLALMSAKGWERSIALWTLAGVWASKQETDGHVPATVVKRFGFSAADAMRLVNVGLWDDNVGDYAFHDWADSNPTKQALEQRRGKTRERVANWRDRSNVTPLQQALLTPLASDSVTLLPSQPVPARPSPAREREDRAPSPALDLPTSQRLGAMDKADDEITQYEALQAINAARSGVGNVMHTGHVVDTAIYAYLDTLTGTKAERLDRITSAHAAWIAAGDKWLKDKKFPLAKWLENPEGDLLKTKKASIRQPIVDKGPPMLNFAPRIIP